MFEWVIVGGGIHGTYLARELLEAGVEHEEIVILERGEQLLHGFRQQARACGMESLRSNYVHHIGSTPFGLENFANARGRQDELIPTHNYQPRPSLELFLDYADHVIERFELATLHRETTVTGVEPVTAAGTHERLGIQTTDGVFEARNVVLAIGPGGQYRRPEWAEDIARVEHVWDRPVPPAERIDPGEEIWILGGGTTAAQFATSIDEVADSVVICSHEGIERELLEAEPPWLNWEKISAELHTLPPGSKARETRVRAARNDGTVPPYLARRLRESTAIHVRAGTIQNAVPADGRVLCSVSGPGADGHMETADRIILATGFDSVYDHPLVSRTAQTLDLQRGYRGMPVLDDQTLQWQRVDGTDVNCFVTGTLARCTVGPFGPNIPGARRAAERVTAQVRKSATSERMSKNTAPLRGRN